MADVDEGLIQRCLHALVLQFEEQHIVVDGHRDLFVQDLCGFAGLGLVAIESRLETVAALARWPACYPGEQRICFLVLIALWVV